MNLYLLTQSQNSDYDTFDSCVVVAKSPAAAKKIKPMGAETWDDDRTWATDPQHVTATLIGKAGRGAKEGDVIIASFNAG